MEGLDLTETYQPEKVETERSEPERINNETYEPEKVSNRGYEPRKLEEVEQTYEDEGIEETEESKQDYIENNIERTSNIDEINNEVLANLLHSTSKQSKNNSFAIDQMRRELMEIRNHSMEMRKDYVNLVMGEVVTIAENIGQLSRLLSDRTKELTEATSANGVSRKYMEEGSDAAYKEAFNYILDDKVIISRIIPLLENTKIAMERMQSKVKYEIEKNNDYN
jgi:hypothetical protein